MSTHVRRLVLAAVAASLAACSSPGTAITPAPFQASAIGAAAPAPGDLYVVDPSKSVVNIFDGKPDPSNKITDSKAPLALAFDTNDSLAIANNNLPGRPPLVELYKPFALKQYQLVPLSGKKPAAIAFDNKHLFYVADGAQIEVYRQTTLVRTIKLTESNVHSIVFDSSNAMLVAMADEIAYYKPGTAKANRIINGISPANAVFNSLDAMIVPDKSANHIRIYKPGSPNKPVYIKKGIKGPSWVTVDAQDNIYVANNGNSTIGVYDHDGKPKYTVKAGIDRPSRVLLAPSGYLWVCNRANVTGYKPKATSVDQTLNTHCKDFAVAP